MIIAALCTAIALTATALITLFWVRRVTPIELAPDLYLFEGQGGNSLLLKGAGKALLVDTKFWKFSNGLAQTAQVRLKNTPIRDLINTHHHWDHTHGNHFFPGSTLNISANALNHMRELDASYFAKHLADQVKSARVIRRQDLQLDFNDQIIHLLSLGIGHTDGDLVVYFPKQRVVATGDLFFHGYYPFVDHAAGGSYLRWIETLDRVLALGARILVPGHGPPAGPADLKAFQGYLRDLITAVTQMKSAGKSRGDVMGSISLPIHEQRLRNLYQYSSLAQNAGAVYDELLSQDSKRTGGQTEDTGSPDRSGQDATQGTERQKPSVQP